MILTAIDKHAPLVRKNFTRTLAPWMKDIEISHLQWYHWLHEAHKNPINEKWQNIWDVKNEIKITIKKKLSFTGRFYDRKTVKTFGKTSIVSCAQMEIRLKLIQPYWINFLMKQLNDVIMPYIGSLITHASPISKVSNPVELKDNWQVLILSILSKIY